VFATFDDGWRAARQASGQAHEHPSIADLHIDLAKTLRPSDYAVLYWLLRLTSKELNVFDFGGNVGNLYYSYLPYVQPLREVHWTVFDLPAVVERGRSLARERSAANLRFTDSAREMPSSCILLVSGSFHYWEGSVQTFLEQFTKPPEHILLNRTPIHETEATFVTVQCTETCAFPCVVRNAREMMNQFSKQGYATKDRWRALELSIENPFFPDFAVPYYSGFYFRRRTE
jgi:putative methyltransferase (TIGR04325 family)